MADIAMARALAGLAADADTTKLSYCLKAAEQWYAKAGVPAPAETESTDETTTDTSNETTDTDGYNFWVSNLAVYFLDNIGTVGEDARIPPYFLASLHQLRPAATQEADA